MADSCTLIGRELPRYRRHVLKNLTSGFPLSSVSSSYVEQSSLYRSLKLVTCCLNTAVLVQRGCMANLVTIFGFRKSTFNIQETQITLKSCNGIVEKQKPYHCLPIGKSNLKPMGHADYVSISVNRLVFYLRRAVTGMLRRGTPVAPLQRDRRGDGMW